jgi:hypothetical protein
MRDQGKKQAKKTPEQEALERRVDEMMDPKRSGSAADEAKPAAVESKVKISAVAAPVPDAPGTAPQLSPKLRKQIAVTDTAPEPLKIDKLDELTEQITAKKPVKKKAARKPPAEKPAAEEAPAPVAGAEAPAPDQPDVTGQSTDFDDTETDKAVDDIVAYEGDVMLAVADSTAEEHNREVQSENAPKGHPVFSTFVWTVIAACVILIIVLVLLLVMGDSLATKLGL